MMLRRLSYILVLLLMASCYGKEPLLTPDDDGGSPSTVTEPADAFVGTYVSMTAAASGRGATDS